MNINSVNFYKINLKSAFKGETQTQQPAATSPIAKPQAPVTAAPASAIKAYAAPQMNNGYKIKEVFSIPFFPNQKFYELSNGMKVITIKRPGNTAIYTKVGVGQLNEPDDKKGMAHLTEHLLGHEGLSPKDEEDKKLINDTGADFNAETGDVLTKYYTKAPINDEETLDKFIKLQAKILKNTDFARSEDEKKVINEEISGSSKAAEDIDYQRQEVMNTLWGQNNLHNPNSTKQTLSNITNQDLTNFYNKYYNPKNMLTVIVGNVNDNTINLVAKDFADLKQLPQPQTQTGVEISTDNPIQKTVRKDIIGTNEENKDKDSVGLGFVGPKQGDINATYYTDFVKRAIEYKMSKEEDSPLVLAYTRVVSNDINKPTLSELHYSSPKEETEKDLKKLYKVINELQTKPLTQTEINDIKNLYKNLLSVPIEHPDKLAAILTENPTDLPQSDKTLEYLDSFNPQTFQDIAKKYFDLNKAAITVVHPKPEETKDTKSDALKTAPKTAKVSFTGNVKNKTDLHMEDVHEYILPNNLKVIIDAREGNLKSVVSFEAKMQKLENSNPARKFFEKCLPSSKQRDFNREKEIFGYFTNEVFSKKAAFDGNKDNALDLVKQARDGIFAPELLSQKEFLEKKEELLSEKPEEKYLSEKIAKSLNSESAMYSNAPGWINNYTYEDYLKSEKDFLNNVQGCITISIPKEDFEKDRDLILKELETAPTLKPNNYAEFYNKLRPQPLEKNMVFTEENNRNSNEIEVTKHFKIVETGNIKDRAALVLTSQILGGDTDSKLFDKLRNKDKICYSPMSSVNSRSDAGDTSSLCMTAKTTADKKDGLKTILNEFDNSIKELENNKISETDLDRAKAKLKTSILEDIESTAYSNDSISIYATSTFYGKDYLQELSNAIDTITPDDIQQYAKYYLSQHSITGVKANKSVLDENKQFLETQGEIQV